MKKSVNLVIPWIVPVILLLSWQVLSIGFISSRILPNPIDIFKAAIELGKSG